MPYLVIKPSDYQQSTSYQMTSNCNEPRLVVGGSYIPLTNTGGDSSDLKVKDNNGNTYRAMEYKSSSSSSSVQETTGYSGVSSRVSYYQTTLDNPSGLSSVTNLTRAETYNTVYLTAAQTTGQSILISSQSEQYANTLLSISGGTTTSVVLTAACQANQYVYMTFTPPIQEAVSLIKDRFYVMRAAFRNVNTSSTSTYTDSISARASVTLQNATAEIILTNMTCNQNYSTSISTSSSSSLNNNSTMHTNGRIYLYTRISASTVGMGIAIPISPTPSTMSLTGTYRTSYRTSMNNYTLITEVATGTKYFTEAITTGTVYQTRVSTSAYAGSSSRQSDYYTSSTDQANMSNITNLTRSSSESASMMTWV